ncbi:DUF6931 family protein [Vibrio tapetis]|uniref:Twin-arginine translocation pathway signal n=1 Tax=Vibrio tapetis subsp. tapetis TaxID=1671868 RepID=A0A2N8ZJN5_9VIBR|nr:hypothetical protein [Vibrio tapetis]SON52130.1 conserved protein of unknown function [Vibrio tapetis subsp. tapetis]
MTYRKIPYPLGQQVLQRFTPSEEALALILDEQPTDVSIEQLIEHRLHNDLMQFIAHALPVREAIWWAARTLDQRQDIWSPMQIQCIDTAKQWVQSPSEALRRKSELFAQRLDLNCGPSWLAQAVFWNGAGSIVTPDLPVVLPDPFLYAKAVAGSINHAAALPSWDKSEQYYQTATQLGLEIAKGESNQ